jgi:hypothetical protein
LLQDPQGFVVSARAGQGAAEVIERGCGIDAAGSGTPLAEADSAPRNSDGLLEVNGGDEHVAEIEQAWDELNALGSEMRFLDSKGLPGERERLIARRPPVQDERTHQSVGGVRHFQAVVLVRRPQRVDIRAGPGFALLEESRLEQCVRVRRNDSFALLPD